MSLHKVARSSNLVHVKKFAITIDPRKGLKCEELLPRVLSHMPLLQCFSFAGFLRVNFAVLQQLHKSCPRLKALHLSFPILRRSNVSDFLRALGQQDLYS